MARIDNIEIKCQGTVIARGAYGEINPPVNEHSHKFTVPNAQWAIPNFSDYIRYLQKDCQLTGVHPPNGSPFNATMKLSGITGGTTIHFD